MRKILNSVFVVLIIIMAILPYICMNRKEEEISKIDNRKLVEAPVFGDEGFTDDYEQYLEDRIGFRNEIVKAYAGFNNIVAHELAHPVYTYGTDGYVFFKMSNNIQYNEYHQSFVEMVLKIQEYCEERGCKFYFIFEPEKISVYRKYLPKGVNYDDSWVDEMCSYMEHLGIHYVNSTKILSEKSTTEQVFNVKYDAGHWNDLGCFYATNTLLALIHKDFPQVEELQKKQFDITMKTETMLPVSEFPIHEEVPSFTLKTKYRNVSKQYMNEIDRNKQFGHFHFLINEENNADKLPRILFFQGSYYNRAPQFFVSQCSDYIGVHNYQNILNLEYYFNIFQPDVVILDAAEYVFTDRYFDSGQMKSLDLNPALLDCNISFREQVEKLKKDMISIQGIDIHADRLIGKKVDRIFIDKEFSDEKYAYLIMNGRVYDMYRDGHGALEASVMHEYVDDLEEAILFIEDVDGDKFWSTVPIREAQNVANELETSVGASIDEESINFKTNLRRNRFSSVVLQVYDGKTGEYLESINSGMEGEVEGKYTHSYDTGLYKIVLKGNTNLMDESVSFMTHFIQGVDYYYTFNVESLKNDEITVKDFSFFGYAGEESQIIPRNLTESEGAHVYTNGKIVFNTELEQNCFNAVVLQIYDAETGAFLENITSSLEGNIEGIYTHHYDTGSYKIVLKGNTNLKDESVSEIVDIEEGSDFYYAFKVNAIEDKKVVVEGYRVFEYLDD